MRLRRFYTVLSKINHLLVRERDPQALFGEVCRVAVEDGGFVLAWVGKYNGSTQRVDVVASAGSAQDYLTTLNIDLTDPVRRRGPSARTILGGEHVIVDDFLSDETTRPWKESARAHGLGSSAAFPLVVAGAVWGQFGLYSSELGYFDAEVVRLLDELALDLSFALLVYQQSMELQASTFRLHQTLDSLLEGCMILGFDWRYLFVNETPARHGRQDRDNLVGKTMLEVYPGIEASAIFQKYRRCMEARVPQNFEEQFTFADGSTGCFEFRVDPVPDGIFILSLDTTAARKAREDLKAMQNHLFQAQKLESLGTLASGVAHDFNNLLAIILHQAALMDSPTADPARRQKSLEAIKAAGTRGTSLVKQLLTFARHNDFKKEPVLLNDLVSEVLILMEEALPPSVSLVFVAEPELPPIAADSGQLHQLCLNLCLNARDAMPSGGRLTIATAKSEQGAILRVSDTGTGMDEATRRKIFEPFFTTKALGKGTGLGLATVFGIVQGHQGTIAVESEPGCGTTFECRFPWA